MKIKDSFREKFNYFVKCGEGISFTYATKKTEGGKSAIEAFLIYESTGKFVPTAEPAEFDLALAGKKSHAITVKAKAEDWFVGVYNKFDLEAEIPWVRADIEGAIRKKRRGL